MRLQPDKIAPNADYAHAVAATLLSGSARRFANSVASPVRRLARRAATRGGRQVVSDSQHWISIAAATGQRAIDACVTEVLTTAPARHGCAA